MTDYRAALKVEYAGKVYQCTKCGVPIPERELCFAYLVETNPTGESRERVHCNCFLDDDGNVPTSPAEIKNFFNLRYEDQKRIAAMIIDKDSFRHCIRKIGNFCSICGDDIEEGIARISAAARNDEKSTQVHVECYSAHLIHFPWLRSAHNLPGYRNLSKTQREVLLKEFNGIATELKQPSGAQITQPAAGNTSSDLESALKSQSDRVFNLQKDLETEMSMDQLSKVFEHNVLRVPEGRSRRIERLAEAIAFGVLPACPQCTGETLRLRNGSYKCQGHFSEYTWCDYVSSEVPARSKLRIPEDLRQRFPFLDSPVERRVLPDRGERRGTVDDTIEVRKIRKLLLGKRIVVEGKTKDAILVRAKLLRLGCEIGKGVTSGTLCLISTADCISRSTKLVQEARGVGVIVLSMDIVDQLDGKVPYQPALCKISTWGATAEFNFGGSPELTSREATQSYEWSNSLDDCERFPVDPQCSVASTTEVCQLDETVYSCVLGKFDLSRGINSHCRLQLLKSGLHFIVFQSISDAPNKSLNWALRETTHRTFASALSDFETQFLDLTGNSWRSVKKFVKLPGKFDVIKTGFVQNQVPGIASTAWYGELEAVRSLIVEINPKLDGNPARRETIDFQENPLGVISATQLTKAYIILAELQSLIENEKPSHLQFLDGSNKFYTTIPHSFDASSPPPLLDNRQILKEKQDMLDRWARKWISRRVPGCSSLGIEIGKILEDEREFGLIQKHCDAVCEGAKLDHTFEVLDVFFVEREGESERFKPYERSDNRRMLWHGSPLANFESILRSGLRIGSASRMFGQALYFADSVGKSAGYCRINGEPADLMYLLLCEVALGNMHECKSEILKELPTGKDSIKGVGKNRLTQREELDGCPLAMGPMQPCSGPTLNLNYDEYVIYDAARVRIKYLVEIRRVR